MPSPIQRLRAWVPSREQLEAKPGLRRLAPHLAHPKLWHWSRRGVATGIAIGLFIGLAIPVVILENLGAIGVPLAAGLGIAGGVAAIAAYLLISQAWAWRVVAKRRLSRS